MNKRTKISSFIKHLKLLRMWFYPETIMDNNRLIKRFDFFQANALVFLFISSIINYLSNNIISCAITVVAALCMCGVNYLIFKRKLNLARVIITTVLNVTLLALSYVEGTSTGNYLFYFVLLAVFICLVRANEIKSIFLMYGITMVCIFISFIFCSDSQALEKMSPEMARVNFLVNLFLSISITSHILYMLLRDTFRKEAILTSKQEFLDAVYNTSLDAVFIVDPSDMTIKGCNEQSLLLFDASNKNSFIGNQVNRFFEQKDPDGNTCLEAILRNSKNASWKGEFNCFTYGGSIFCAYVSVVVLKYEGNEYTKINILDISDIKKAKNDLIAAKEKAEEADEIKSRFISNMSHEIRTPLNGIIGTTHLLLQAEHNAEQKAQLDMLKYSSEHMLSLVNDLLDFNKLERGNVVIEKSVLNLNDFINKVEGEFKLQFEKKKLSFFIDVDERLNKLVESDFTRLHQLLGNLLSNSLKFTEKGGAKLSVQVIETKKGSAKVEFSVFDTGIGIDGRQREKVFESFTQADMATTRKYGGTGLGLSISYKLAELFGGKLQLESVANQGSRFSFEIEMRFVQQLKAVENFGTKKVLLHDAMSLHGMKVLVAEDNPVNMQIATRFLQKWGIEITEAKDGLQALNLFNNEQFDLLLVDLEMPEIDGFGVIKSVRKLGSTVPAIAFTATAIDNIKEALEDCGFNGYIRKPFKPEDLYNLLKQFYTGETPTIRVA